MKRARVRGRAEAGEGRWMAVCRKIGPAPSGILTFNNKARESRVVRL